MKTCAYVLLATVLLTLTSGCGSDKDRGMNRPDLRKDLPRSAPPEDKK